MIRTVQPGCGLLFFEVHDIKAIGTLHVHQCTLGGAQGGVRSGDVYLGQLHGYRVRGHGEVRHGAGLRSLHAAEFQALSLKEEGADDGWRCAWIAVF